MGNDEVISRLAGLHSELSRKEQQGHTDHLAYETLGLSKKALALVPRFEPEGSPLALQAQKEAAALLRESIVKAVRY